MRRGALLTVAMLASISGLAFAAWIPQARGPVSPRSLPGWAVYDRYCLACHGASGDGRGPAAPYTWSAPRSFVRGEYKWRTTPLGQPPTDDDLRASIAHGATGTSMPGFDGILTPAAIDQLVDVVKAFAPASFVTTPKAIVLGDPPARDPARGAALWITNCRACHGTGAGDGPSAFALATKPYEFTTQPLRRPREGDDLDARRRAAATSIATGLAGTPMPSFTGVIPDADIWALADHVVAINERAARRDRSALDAAQIEADRATPVAVGTWPGRGDTDEAKVFAGAIAPQGPPPPSLAPAQASLAAQQCARCHNKQYREWRPSLHSGATSPGLAAQMFGMTREAGAACLRCHAPLPEQQDTPALHADGISCAGCHLRGWTRHGPPNVTPSLLALPSYPAAPLALYERGDFCMPCHQLPPRTAIAGKPLLNTYKEWLEGPYMRRGVQCQHCHMPNREHTFLGVHDPATFRQGIALTGRASVKNGTVTVHAELANVGAGHYLPTTPTPAAWLTIELLDARGVAIAGASARHRIGRDIYFDGVWHERADTRIPPGGRAMIARGWSGGRTAAAVTARVTVEVHPDDYYERLYESQLRGTLPVARRALYQQALTRGRAARYVATRQDLAIERR